MTGTNGHRRLRRYPESFSAAAFFSPIPRCRPRDRKPRWSGVAWQPGGFGFCHFRAGTPERFLPISPRPRAVSREAEQPPSTALSAREGVAVTMRMVSWVGCSERFESGSFWGTCGELSQKKQKQKQQGQQLWTFQTGPCSLATKSIRLQHYSSPVAGDYEADSSGCGDGWVLLHPLRFGQDPFVWKPRIDRMVPERRAPSCRSFCSCYRVVALFHSVVIQKGS
mmetsp:Transcript_30285/g.71375  ORF Transcript_30285/g.71375 Transcript_30285/m.71375 type:complete len:224 (-) Transcript_30285:108-779(-)